MLRRLTAGRVLVIVGCVLSVCEQAEEWIRLRYHNPSAVQLVTLFLIAPMALAALPSTGRWISAGHAPR